MNDEKSRNESSLDNSCNFLRHSVQRGILILANGARDLLRSSFLTISLRKVGYFGPILSISDESKLSFESRWYKTQLCRFSPFEETLFLDADTIAIRPFDHIWKYLNIEDLWMARDLHPVLASALEDKTSRATAEERNITGTLCKSDQPFFNSGTILFRKSEIVTEFFDSWHREWCRYRMIDQFAAARAMKITGTFPAELPGVFNHSLRRYRKEPNADVVFLHCWGFPRNKYASYVKPFIQNLREITEEDKGGGRARNIA